MHGYGMLSSNDLFYDGEFKMGKMHGFAKVWSVKSDHVFKGKFKEGVKHGFGIFFTNDEHYLVRNHKGKGIFKVFIKNYESFLYKTIRLTVFNYRYYYRLIKFMLVCTFKKKSTD